MFMCWAILAAAAAEASDGLIGGILNEVFDGANGRIGVVACDGLVCDG